jgi:hypothetical protein
VGFVERSLLYKTLYSVSKTESNWWRKSQQNTISYIHHEKNDVYLIKSVEISFAQAIYRMDEMEPS